MPRGSIPAVPILNTPVRLTTLELEVANVLMLAHARDRSSYVASGGGIGLNCESKEHFRLLRFTENLNRARFATAEVFRRK
jgi:hypothetical protein